jgi:hypothetical protein
VAASRLRLPRLKTLAYLKCKYGAEAQGGPRLKHWATSLGYLRSKNLGFASAGRTIRTYNCSAVCPHGMTISTNNRSALLCCGMALNLRGSGPGEDVACGLDGHGFFGAALAGYEDSDALDHLGRGAASLGEEDVGAAGAIEGSDCA